MTFWDRTGSINTTALTSPVSIVHYTNYGSEHSIGWQVDSGSYSKALLGIIYKISFYNTLEGANPGAREAFINQHKDDYFLHFDLGNQDQNFYDENKIQK